MDWSEKGPRCAASALEDALDKSAGVGENGDANCTDFERVLPCRAGPFSFSLGFGRWRMVYIDASSPRLLSHASRSRRSANTPLRPGSLNTRTSNTLRERAFLNAAALLNPRASQSSGPATKGASEMAWLAFLTADPLKHQFVTLLPPGISALFSHSSASSSGLVGSFVTGS